MQFYTSIPLSKSDAPIDYSSKVLALGSCFAENMGERLSYFKFQQAVNPFGIIFNPVSLENLLKRAIHKRYFTESEVFFHNDLWYSFEVHSGLSHPNQKEFLATLNHLIDTTHTQITQATHLILTLGTSWVYRHVDKNEIVANCHKIPQKVFQKELLPAATIEKSLQEIISQVKAVNQGCNIIITVSPVRHLKDGFVENTLSKAHLITALHAVIYRQPSQVVYFPAYEILMDELREYRFYTQDMLHPNAVAIDYIWRLFSENYCTEAAQHTMKEVDSIQKSLTHRPFNPNTPSHEQFLKMLAEKIATVKALHPHIEF